MYKATVHYNNDSYVSVEGNDLKAIKDIMCTYSFTRLDVRTIKIYKNVGKYKLIGTIEKGSYNEG